MVPDTDAAQSVDRPGRRRTRSTRTSTIGSTPSWPIWRSPNIWPSPMRCRARRAMATRPATGCWPVAAPGNARPTTNPTGQRRTPSVGCSKVWPSATTWPSIASVEQRRKKSAALCVVIGQKYFDGYFSTPTISGDGFHTHHAVVEWGSLGVAALALQGEAPQAEAWLAATTKKFEDHLLPLGLAPDGAQVEGPTFWASTMHYRLFFMDALRRVTGNDLFKSHARHMNADLALAAIADPSQRRLRPGPRQHRARAFLRSARLLCPRVAISRARVSPRHLSAPGPVGRDAGADPEDALRDAARRAVAVRAGRIRICVVRSDAHSRHRRNETLLSCSRPSTKLICDARGSATICWSACAKERSWSTAAEFRC